MAQSLRHNDSKVPLSKMLLFRRGLEMLVRVMTQGEIKYPDVADTGLPNWMQGGKADHEYLDCIQRHLADLVNLETWDEELGTHHAAHIAWNALALLTLNTEGPLLNPEHDQEAFVAKWRAYYEDLEDEDNGN